MVDFHTQYEGFGLTLEGKALSWFQTLEPERYSKFEQVEEGFIMAFSKMGIKHNTVAQIYNFKQKSHETVRDCANRMRQYISRCPAREIPSQEPLVSLFLEGLSNKTLHVSLYGKKHKTLNECILDAIDLDDNCDIFGHTTSHILGFESSTVKSSETRKSNHPKSAEAIAEEVMKRMNLAMRQPQRQP